MEYRSVTYKNGVPSFGEWTDLQTAFNQAQACTEYAWVEDELHNRVVQEQWTADEILKREG